MRIFEALITGIRNDTDNTMDNRMAITRKQKWEGKQLENMDLALKKGNLKRETVSLPTAAHNIDKARIEKTQQNSRCR